MPQQDSGLIIFWSKAIKHLKHSKSKNGSIWVDFWYFQKSKNIECREYFYKNSIKFNLWKYKTTTEIEKSYDFECFYDGFAAIYDFAQDSTYKNSDKKILQLIWITILGLA